MQVPEHYSRRRRCADDPTKVIARADKPIVAGCNCSESVAGQGKDCLTCGTPYDIAGQTPQVTFADGLAPMGNDEFVVRAAALPLRLFEERETDPKKLVHRSRTERRTRWWARRGSRSTCRRCEGVAAVLIKRHDAFVEHACPQRHTARAPPPRLLL